VSTNCSYAIAVYVKLVLVLIEHQSFTRRIYQASIKRERVDHTSFR
jgi:hypothetical protein